MNVEVLISACKRKSISELNLKEKNINKAVIVNQFMPKSIKKNKDYIMYSYDEKGIAKSRNRLLENMTGDIEIISDDDITFVSDYENIVKKAYKENKNADIIIFNLKKGDEIIGFNKSFKYNNISIMSICSCQITFRKNSILKNKIKFDERFGIGSNYISGEENIFLKDAIGKGLNIIHIPIVICKHPKENTTGENWNDKVIKSKGAFSYRAYKKIYIFLLLYFSLLKYKYYKKNYSLFGFIKLFNKGKKEFKKQAGEIDGC